MNAAYRLDRFSAEIRASVENEQSRYAMFSVKWNFGKMNPAKNARVQNAMFNML